MHAQANPLTRTSLVSILFFFEFDGSRREVLRDLGHGREILRGLRRGRHRLQESRAVHESSASPDDGLHVFLLNGNYPIRTGPGAALLVAASFRPIAPRPLIRYGIA